MAEPTLRAFPDRRVHARKGAIEIVRYERAGKWYEEKVASEDGYRRPLTVRDAARIAVALSASGGELYLGIPGGNKFERELGLARRDGEQHG